MAKPLETIVELQNALARLREAERQLDGIPDWMTELDAEYQERKAEIEAQESQAEEAASERRGAEGEISEMQEKLKRYQQQINEVSTQREYGALLQEIDTAKSRISELEEVAFGAMERIDSANKALEEQREAFRDLDERYQVELQKWEKEKPVIAEQAEKLRGTVETLRERLPRGQLALFERVYERTDGQAMAAIRKVERLRGGAMWHCAACNYNVRPQVVVEIQDRGALLHCDSCKRILYVEAEADGDDPTAEPGQAASSAEG